MFNPKASEVSESSSTSKLNAKATSYCLVYKQGETGEVTAKSKKHSGPRKRRKKPKSLQAGEREDDDQNSVISSMAASSHDGSHEEQENESWFDLHRSWALSKRPGEEWRHAFYQDHNQLSEYVMRIDMLYV